jgi:hypothetical protein
MHDVDLQATVEAYLQAYGDRDLPRCLDFFAEDATIRFAMGTYAGLKAIEGWHEDRFAANLRVIRIDEIRTQGNAVTVEMVGTSKVAKLWRVDSVAGTATFVIENGKMTEVTFGLRSRIPLEGW